MFIPRIFPQKLEHQEHSLPEQFSLLVWNIHKENQQAAFQEKLTEILHKKPSDFILFQEVKYPKETPYHFENYSYAIASNIETSKNIFGVLTAAKVAFDLADAKVGKVDIATSSKGEDLTVEAKKVLNLPGEYDISGVLVRGFYTHNDKNIVFKITMEDVVIAHFGDLPAISNVSFFDVLGENVDVALLTLREGFDVKSAKEFLEKVDPRMVIFGGDAAVFPKIVELFNAKIVPESEVSVSRSSLPSDTTDFLILSV